MRQYILTLLSVTNSGAGFVRYKNQSTILTKYLLNTSRLGESYSQASEPIPCMIKILKQKP
jgi:hypothetical protein